MNVFQDKLAEVLECYSLTTAEIFNLDETGCTTVQRVATAHEHKVGQAISREKEELLTLVAIKCANGKVPTPAFVSPRDVS